MTCSFFPAVHGVAEWGHTVYVNINMTHSQLACDLVSLMNVTI